MAYSDITFKDKNPIKAWLQSRRLVVAMQMVAQESTPACIVDFGAGNGELCKLIAGRFPRAKIICYEPTPSLMDEAKDNLAAFAQVVFCDDISALPDGCADLVFCLEVFEHLPPKETSDALGQFERLLGDQGRAVIGVPVEIGVPAFYKGLFRMTRRFGEFDASVGNVIRATLGMPPKARPVVEISPGFAFYLPHMGFDYRRLQSQLSHEFKLVQVTTSPSPVLGTWINPEVNFLVERGVRTPATPRVPQRETAQIA